MPPMFGESPNRVKHPRDISFGESTPMRKIKRLRFPAWTSRPKLAPDFAPRGRRRASLAGKFNAYENGSRLPTPTEITILSKALGKRAAYLMGLEDETEEQLLRNWRTLNERERMDIFRKVEAMAATSRDPVQDQVVARHLGTPRKPAVTRARRPG